MKWIKERDLLIAQTLAFVQSVTGKKADAGTPLVQAGFEAAPIDVAKLAFEIIAPTRVTQPTETDAASLIEAAPAPVSRAAGTGEFRAEIQNRVANFRAHQQRVSREREEYCSATLAKIQAAINDDSLYLPRGQDR